MNKVKEFFQKHGQVALWSILLWSILVFLFASFIFVIFSNWAACLFANGLGTGSKQETLEFIGFAMGGILAALGAIAVNRRANAQVENNKLIEKGHVDERFKAAVEHLGEDKTEIAAYYEFYSLAKRHENLRESVFNILCGRLRKVTTSEDYKTRHPDNPSENMQTLLDVLFKSKDRNVFDNLPANLERTYLVGANLENANMRFANFQKATLQKVKFLKANLQEAKFHETNLQHAEFHEANLQGATFSKTDLQHAKFQKANLQNATFESSARRTRNLENADFREANLQNAKFLSSDLGTVTANLENVNFHKANLQNVIFWNVNLQCVTFFEADLRGASLSLTECVISETIESAIIDEKTQLPEGVTHPSRKEKP